MMKKTPVITIDGPSGAGKSVLSKKISEKLNWCLLESGKIYRLVAFLVLNEKISIIEDNIISFVKNLDFLSIKKKIKHLHHSIYCKRISEVSSQLAAYPKIRKILLKQQRLFRRSPGLIAEGRDMGTVVFPDAILKFFLKANLEIRVERRMLELNKYGYNISFKELFIQMQIRDEYDQNRLISPLCAAKNAIVLDSTYMSLSEVIQACMKHVIKKTKILL